MTAELLTAYETCNRKAYLESLWEPNKLSSKDMLSKAIRAGLLAPVKAEEEDGALGDIAGSEVLQLAADRGLDTDGDNLFSKVMHIAALSDILISAIRKDSDPAWLTPEPVQNWTSSAFLSPDGSHLRRIVLVSHWNDQRHYSECKSWFTLGEMAHYRLPMKLAVLVIGQERNGKRHTPWTMGYQHPLNKQLRFRKRSRGSRSEGNVFNDKWGQIWREDHDEISREKWLQSMLTDDILRDVCFSVDVPVPDKTACWRVRDMAIRKLERLSAMTEPPETQLVGCEWPIPCQFRKLCPAGKMPSEKSGFLSIRTSGV